MKRSKANRVAEAVTRWRLASGKHRNFTGRVKKEVAPWNRFTGDVPASRANWGGVPAGSGLAQPPAAPAPTPVIGPDVVAAPVAPAPVVGPPSGFQVPGLGPTPQIPTKTAGFGGYAVGLLSVAALFFVIGYSLEYGRTTA